MHGATRTVAPHRQMPCHNEHKHVSTAKMCLEIHQFLHHYWHICYVQSFLLLPYLDTPPESGKCTLYCGYAFAPHASIWT